MKEIYCGIICMEWNYIICKMYWIFITVIYINWNVSKHLEIHANMKAVKVRTVKNKFKKVILCH